MSKRVGAAQTFTRLLTPSWFEFITLLIATLSAGLYLATQVLRNDKNFQEYVRQTSSNIHEANATNPGLSDTYNFLSGAINNSQIIGDATIFFLWAIIGLMLYNLIMSLWHMTQREISFFERLQFAPKTNKKLLLENATLGLSIRLAALVGLIAFGGFFRYTLLPQIIRLFLDIFQEDIATAVLHASAGIALLLLCLHIFVVLIRISLLRVRVFFTKYSYID